MELKWYQKEIPQTVEVDCYRVNLFLGMGRLQFSSLRWDDQRQEMIPGKTFTVRLASLGESEEALCLIEKALRRAKELKGG
jgi:hypothetical protein